MAVMAATIQSVPSEVLSFYTCIYYIVTIYDSTLRAWDLIYHSPSINCSHFPSGKIKSIPLSRGTFVWTSEANKASGEAGCPSSYLVDNGHHISSNSAKQWLTWAGGVLKSGSCPSCSPEYCLLILRLPTAFNALGGTCDRGHLQWLRLPLLQDFFRAQS